MKTKTYIEVLSLSLFVFLALLSRAVLHAVLQLELHLGLIPARRAFC